MFSLSLQVTVSISCLHSVVIDDPWSTGGAQFYALILLPIALIFVVYPLNTFVWRNNKIRNRDTSRWDDPVGPVIITVLLIIALSIQFFMKVGFHSC